MKPPACYFMFLLFSKNPLYACLVGSCRAVQDTDRCRAVGKWGGTGTWTQNILYMQ